MASQLDVKPLPVRLVLQSLLQECLRPGQRRLQPGSAPLAIRRASEARPGDLDSICNLTCYLVGLRATRKDWLTPHLLSTTWSHNRGRLFDRKGACMSAVRDTYERPRRKIEAKPNHDITVAQMLPSINQRYEHTLRRLAK